MRSRYFLSICDQGALSAFNFLLSILLIKTMQPEFFGTFVFWNSIALLASGLQTSLISTPMSVFIPAAGSSAERRRTEGIFLSANFILMLAVFSVIVAANLLFSTEQDEGISLALIIAAFVSGTLLREYTRSTGFAHQNVGSVILADGVHLAVACIIFAYFLLLREPIGLEAVFGSLALGSILGGLIGLVCRKRSERILSVTGFTFRAYGPIWEQSKWGLLGALTTQAQSRGYVYLLSAFAGPAAVAMIAAGEILYRPASLLMTAWGRIARPHFSSAVSAGRYGEIEAILRKTLTLIVGSLIFYYIFLYAAWSPLRDFIYEDKYDMIGWIVVAWGMSNLFMLVQGIYSIALQSFKRFKLLSLSFIVGSIVSLSVIMIALYAVDYRYSVLGNVCGALTSGIFIYRAFWIVSRKMKNSVDP